MKEGYVYRWTDSSNGKKYIGSHNGKKRSYKGSGKHFKSAYNKRPECFTREILYTGPDYLELEEFILETVDAKNDDMYYNLSNQSLGGPVMIGEEHPMYGTKHSPETIEKMSKNSTGKRNGMYGKTHSPEKRKQISERQYIKVKELSTGLSFNSVKECATYFNLDSGTISYHLKKNRPITMGSNKGKHFVYEEQNN